MMTEFSFSVNVPLKNMPICWNRKKSLFKSLETNFLAYLWKMQCFLHVCILEGLNVCAHASSVCGVLDVGGALHKGRERERASESERDLLQWLMGVFCETQPGAEHNHGPRLTLQQTCPSHGKERGPLLPPAHHPAWLLPLLHLPSYCSPGRERETEKVSVSTTASVCVCVCVLRLAVKQAVWGLLVLLSVRVVPPFLCC